jgi:hypothetical protein
MLNAGTFVTCPVKKKYAFIILTERHPSDVTPVTAISAPGAIKNIFIIFSAVTSA